MTDLTLFEQCVTIGVCILATVLSRFLPFLIFRDNKETPAFIQYLGRALPSAIFGMLVVYCMRNVDISSANHGIPDFAALAVTVALHAWKRSLILPMIGGTAAYMLLTGIFG